jgi:ABC-2 type transport system permease protein
MILLLRPSGTEPAVLIGDTLQIVAGMAFSGLVFMAIGFFLSSIMKSAQQATPAAIGVVFGTYIMGMFSKAFEENIPGIGKLVYLSPLDYAVPNQIYAVGFELPYILIGCVLIIMTASATFWIYRKKDLMS